MSQPATTKEERYLMALYTMASKLGSFKQGLDRFEVGKVVGLQPKGVKTIANQLAQANFIKKRGESEVLITPLGEELAIKLLKE